MTTALFGLAATIMLDGPWWMYLLGAACLYVDNKDK